MSGDDLLKLKTTFRSKRDRHILDLARKEMSIRENVK